MYVPSLGILYSMTLEMAFRKLNFTLGSSLIFTIYLWDKKGSKAQLLSTEVMSCHIPEETEENWKNTSGNQIAYVFG
jgi:hypothetical protein